MPKRMMFKGYNYTHTHNAVMLPDEHADRPHYCAFGRLCKKTAKGAIKTNRKYNGRSPFGDGPEEGEDGTPVYPVYAKKIQPDGYSLTNLMYGKDGYAYLAYDGSVFVRKCKLKKPNPIGQEQLKRMLKIKLDPLADKKPNDDEVLTVLADYVLRLTTKQAMGNLAFEKVAVEV